MLTLQECKDLLDGEVDKLARAEGEESISRDGPVDSVVVLLLQVLVDAHPELLDVKEE